MKKLTRKAFIDLSLINLAAVPFISMAARGEVRPGMVSAGENSANTYADGIGFQVFAFRDALLRDAGGLFKSFAGAGVKSIEFFNPAKLTEYVPIVKDNGMNPLCTHFMPGYVTGNWTTARQMNMAPPEHYYFENIIADCVKNGIKYMGIAILLDEDRPTLDDYKRFADKFNTCGEQCKKAGVQLYYHNHSFEFQPVNGTTPYEEMLKIFDKDLIKIEIDVFWLTVAGLNPIQWIEKLSDRLLFLHMKDLKKGSKTGVFNFDIPGDSFVELGTGMLDYKAILTEARKAGIQYAIIDQDSTQMEDKIASVRQNCEYIRSLGI
jgi:sugar phosphate isomerase/epimerase